MTHLVRKSGIPVLAYPKHNDTSPVSLSLIIICNEHPPQATLCLQSSLFIHGFKDAQTFILQYDADNFVPGPLSLNAALITLPQTQLKKVVRNGNPQIRTLSLTLKKACPIWCPQSSVSPAPKHGFETSFDQLLNLAKATELDILFDYNWLHRNAHTLFDQLIEHSNKLSGFPVHKHYNKLYRCVDWSVFKIRDTDAHADADATTEDEEPPPVYTEASSKRPRHVSTSPTSTFPPPKRIHASPYLGGIYTSSTEETSIATPSPKLPHFPAALSPKLSPLAPLSPKPPDFPTIPTPDLQSIVKQTVSTLLPSMVDTLLPNVLESFLPSLLPRFLTASPPAPSSSQQSIGSQISHAPPPAALSALGNTLGEHVVCRIKGELENIYAHTLSHANYLRNTADLEVEEVLKEGMLEFGMEKQHAMDEVERVVDEKLQAFGKKCEEVVEYVEERVGTKADDIVDHTRERLGELENREKMDLEREREEMRKNKEDFRREEEELRKNKEELRKEREGLRSEREDLRSEREDLRREREDLRREREDVRRDRAILGGDQRTKSEERRAAWGSGCGEQRNAAWNLPA